MNMRILFFLLLFTVLQSKAQNTAKPGFAKLKKIEDSMKVPAFKMINERLAAQRFIADSLFIKMLVRALKTPHSFHYPFDSAFINIHDLSKRQVGTD